MLPGKTMLTVSSEEASRIEHQAATRLKRLKKLSLVVDLDQTLLHATMDPVVAEWLSNLSHPFHEASLGIQTLLLADSLSIPYYVKFRNRLHEFLETITPYFDLHIYTMGTWAYADAIAKCIDPLGKYFHDDRIMTRDRYWKDSGDRYGPDTSLLQNWTKKHLKSLFPCQDDMVLILDDRVDVWESSPNLIRIKPYEFFKGFGDINDPSKVATAKSPQGVALPPGQTSATAIYPNSLQAEAQDTQLEIIKNLLLAIHSQYYHNLFTRRLPSETDTKVLD